MAVIKSFEAEYGMSVQIKDVWHRFSCKLAVDFEPGDDLKEVKERAWNTVASEIEKQIKNVLDNQG